MSLSPAGTDPAPISPAGTSPAPNASDLWWAIKLTNGTVGLVKGAEPTSVGGIPTAQAEPIGRAGSLAALMTHFSAAVVKAFVDLGASSRQQAELVGQTDVGAGQDSSVVSLLFPRNGSPAARTSSGAASTQPRGDANPVNLIPSPIPPSAGNSHLSFPGLSGLSGIAVRVLEAVGGLLLLVLGLRAFLGGEAPTVTIARAASKVAP